MIYIRFYNETIIYCLQSFINQYIKSHENIFDALNFHIIKSYRKYLKCVSFVPNH